MTVLTLLEPDEASGREIPGVVQAVWEGTLLAASRRTLQMDGVVYFPPEDVCGEYLTESTTDRVSLAFGQARHFDVTVAGRTDPSAAWNWPPYSIALLNSAWLM